MKKYIIAILLISLCYAGFAQRGYKDKSHEKIESMRIAYITDQLNLSPNEAREFWPVFNEFDKAMRTLRDEERSLVDDNPDVDELKAKSIFDRLMAIEEQELILEKAYITKLGKIIGYQKALKLKSVDRNFKRELLSKMRKNNEE